MRDALLSCIPLSNFGEGHWDSSPGVSQSKPETPSKGQVSEGRRHSWKERYFLACSSEVAALAAGVQAACALPAMTSVSLTAMSLRRLDGYSPGSESMADTLLTQQPKERFSSLSSACNSTNQTQFRME